MADSSEDIQLRELKDMVAELKNLIKTLQETVDAANERENPLHRKGIILRRNSVFYARNFLVHPAKKDLHLLRNRIFLMRQKKNSILLQQRHKKWQLPFLKKTKRRKARAADVERYKGIPVTKEYLNLEEKKCTVCGAGLVSIGEEFVRRELVFIPALNITVSATAARNVKERISLQSKKEKMEKPICCMEWLLRVPLRG